MGGGEGSPEEGAFSGGADSLKAWDGEPDAIRGKASGKPMFIRGNRISRGKTGLIYRLGTKSFASEGFLHSTFE